MSKELTWFKFYPSEWMMGRIQRQSESVQIAFIRLICKYWHKECKLSNDEAILECGADEFEILIRNKIIGTHDSEYISISFLDEQMGDIEYTSLQNSKNAKKRWDKKAKQDHTSALRAHTNGMQNDADKIREDKIIEDKGLKVGLASNPTNGLSFNDRYLKFLEFFNDTKKQHTGRVGRFKGNPKVKKQFKALIGNYNTAEIAGAVQSMFRSKHHKESNYEWATPELITRADKFERFLDNS